MIVFSKLFGQCVSAANADYSMFWPVCSCNKCNLTDFEHHVFGNFVQGVIQERNEAKAIGVFYIPPSSHS